MDSRVHHYTNKRERSRSDLVHYTRYKAGPPQYEISPETTQLRRSLRHLWTVTTTFQCIDPPGRRRGYVEEATRANKVEKENGPVEDGYTFFRTTCRVKGTLRTSTDPTLGEDPDPETCTRPVSHPTSWLYTTWPVPEMTTFSVFQIDRESFTKGPPVVLQFPSVHNLRSGRFAWESLSLDKWGMDRSQEESVEKEDRKRDHRWNKERTSTPQWELSDLPSSGLPTRTLTPSSFLWPHVFPECVQRCKLLLPISSSRTLFLEGTPRPLLRVTFWGDPSTVRLVTPVRYVFPGPPDEFQWITSLLLKKSNFTFLTTKNSPVQPISQSIW